MSHQDPRQRRRIFAWTYVGVAVVMLVAAAAVPEWTTAITALVAVSVPLACVFGVATISKQHRRGWWLEAFGWSCSSIAALMRLWMDFTGSDSEIVNHLAIAITVMAYLGIILGIWRFLQAAGNGASSGALVDGFTVTIAAAMVVGTLLTIPTIEDGPTWGPMWEVGLYPVLSILLAFFTLRFVMAGQRFVPSTIAIVTALGCAVMADGAYLAIDAGASIDPEKINLLYPLASAVMVFALLHPSSVVATSPAPRRVRYLVGTRLATLTTANFVPMLLLAFGAISSEAATVLVAIGGALLVALMFTRVEVAVNTHAATERQVLDSLTTDSVTQLPNRVMSTELLRIWQQDTRSGHQPVSVMLIALEIPHPLDSLLGSAGSAVRDQLVSQFADRLVEEAHPDDFVGRVRDDEFVIFSRLRPATESASFDRAVDLVGAMRKPFPLPIGDSTVRVSVGLSHDESRGMLEADELLVQAAIALDRAKSLGGGTVARYDATRRADAERQVRVEMALQGALGRDELYLVYQPIMHLPTGRVAGFEALMRWHSPTLGQVTPGEFIPLAERSPALMRELGKWAMHEATGQLSRWLTSGADPDLVMSVNLSAHQLDDSSTTDTILGRLKTLDLEGKNLWVEITESVLIREDVKLDIVVSLQRLRDAGISVAADDFGTGYSSLGYLRSFPINHVKIDRTFVSGIGTNAEDDTMVQAVMGMADALQLETVAEGIEEPIQRDRLTALGCTYAQGFLFNKPLSVADAARLLDISEIEAAD